LWSSHHYIFFRKMLEVCRTELISHLVIKYKRDLKFKYILDKLHAPLLLGTPETQHG
jgi:hypothetical protein